MRELLPVDVRSIACHVGSAGEKLRTLSFDTIAAALTDAAHMLLVDQGIGRELREALATTTGLSNAMIEWGLTTTLRTANQKDFLALLPVCASSAEPRSYHAARLAAVVLSGNVFTASFRALCAPLMARVPVVAKASSRDDVFPSFFARALLAVNEDVGRAVRVVVFRGGDVPLEDALFGQCDVVAAYGSDATLHAIRSRLPSTTTFVPHGHGLGIAYVPKSTLPLDAICKRLARDVAAYDQRGCLSPHAIFVERGSSFSVRELTECLSFALDHEEASLPRGVLPLSAGAQQLQWRGIAAARGDLREGATWSIAVERGGSFRLSPGYRNVSLLECTSTDQFCQLIAPLGIHLKCLGVEADAETRNEIAAMLPAPLAPRVCATGRMQEPGLTCPTDGMDPMQGFMRCVSLQ